MPVGVCSLSLSPVSHLFFIPRFYKPCFIIPEVREIAEEPL